MDTEGGWGLWVRKAGDCSAPCKMLRQQFWEEELKLGCSQVRSCVGCLPWLGAGGQLGGRWVHACSCWLPAGCWAAVMCFGAFVSPPSTLWALGFLVVAKIPSLGQEAPLWATLPGNPPLCELPCSAFSSGS